MIYHETFIYDWKLNEFNDNIVVILVIVLYTQHNNYNKRSGSVKSVKCHTTFVQPLV